MEEKSSLYIPVKIRKRKESLEGIGRNEILGIILMTVIGAFIGVVGHFIKGYEMTYVIFPTIGFGCLGYFFLKKDKFNKSTVDNTKQYINFMSSQKKYRYVYYNILEGRYRGRGKNEKK